MDTQPAPPRRIDQIAKYLVDLYGGNTNTLPPPVIIKGISGTGRSWVLNLIRHRLENTNSHNTHIITVPLQLSAKNLVKNIVDQIAADIPNLVMGNSKSGRSIRKKIVLLIDNIDALLNLTQGDQTISASEKAEVFGGIRKQPHSKIIGTNIGKFQHAQDVSEFRSFLIENANRVTIIASSSENTLFMEDPDQPFFQFFNVIELKPFDVHEIKDFIKNRCVDENAENIFSLLNNTNHDWPDVLTEGRITYAKFVIDAVNELGVELNRNEKIDGEALLKRMILLFLGKVSPHIEAIIDNLSYSEKKLIDIAVFLQDGFYANNLKEFDGNISQTLKALKRKRVITSDKEGHNARYEFSSSVFKAYLRFHKNALSRDVLSPWKQFSRR